MMLERCTFAIISHPDAGKTTMTEKFLWHGQVIRQTGMVKSKNQNYAKSDWMELEQERGISVTSSVLSFPYEERMFHLLDTPGHKDFSEDTYRTLTAVESALMVIDSAKGVEAQTIKLMEVCRLRDTPIVTFCNKLDRDAMDPFELIDNLEKILSIQCVPITWPIGHGSAFQGIYHLKKKEITLFDATVKNGPFKKVNVKDLDDPQLKEIIEEENLLKLQEDVQMVEELISPFSQEEFLAGIQTPLYFGSALFNFGVDDILHELATNAPGPCKRPVRAVGKAPLNFDSISPDHKKFSGVIFKIQANMDKNHRDRIAFMRVCSGIFRRNQKIFLVRTQKEIKVPTPLIFQAKDREVIEEAVAGDIIGLYDNGKYRIGDTFTEGELFEFTGIPNFAPEIFMKIFLKDPLKKKQLDKGLTELSEEGNIQLFRKYNGTDKILGAVGQLQFDVVKFRLENEYGVRGEYQGLPVSGIRWITFVDEKAKKDFLSNYGHSLVCDREENICFSFNSPWDLKLAQERNAGVKFFNNSDYKESHQEY